MYRSYSVNNMPKPIMHEPVRAERQEKHPEKSERPPYVKPCAQEKRGGFLDNLQTDDIILAIVILALLLDDCDDKLLIAALGFVFLADFL